MQDKSTKPRQYLHPMKRGGVRIHQRIMISDTLRGFYLVHRRHVSTLKNGETMGMSNPCRKDVWIWTIY